MRDRLPEALERSRHEIAERDLNEQIRQQSQLVETLRSESAAARQSEQHLASELKTMDSRVRFERERAERAIVALEAARNGPMAETQSPSQPPVTAPATRTVSIAPTSKVEVHLDVGKLRFLSTAGMPANVASLLDRSARSVFSSSDQAILGARRALEAVIAGLYQRAFPGGVENLRVGDLLHGLRGHVSMPDADWHLAKNLYSRASAIVHDGGATPQVALWIWLGTNQLAELLEASGGDGPTPQDPATDR